MKVYWRLLLLVVITVPVLYGCDDESKKTAKAATYGAAVFDKSTWK